MQIATGTLQQFPGNGGWIFLQIKKDTLPKQLPKNRWGYTPIVATLGNTSWETSLLPLDKDYVFIAVKKEIRKKEQIGIGDAVRISWKVRV